MGKMEYFPAFFGYLDSLAMLDDAQIGRVFRAALLYARDGVAPELEPLEAMAFAFLRGDIDRAKTKYENKCERLRANGMKGGRPPSENQKEPEETKRFSENQKEPEEPKQDNTKQDNTIQHNNTTTADAEEEPAVKAASVPFKEISEHYKKLCPSFPGIRSIEGARKTAVSARWRMNPDLNVFDTLFRKAEASDFLKGRNDRNWTANFDWMMNADHFSRILEGRYDNRTKPAGQETSFETDSFFEAAVMRAYQNYNAEGEQIK